MPTYEDTLEFLDSFVNFEHIGLTARDTNFDLGKIRRVLRKMGDPQLDYRCVHIAGTKGKGSASAFLSSMLRESGCNVGLYTSPHLTSVRERIRVNGRMIGKRDLVSVADRLREHMDPGFSYFEAFTLMAILHFSMQKVDHAVFEVGLGGRLDATNVINAGVCGISPISYDHTHVLGNTIEEIAGEKVAIIKRKARCVSSPQKPAALEVIREKCEKENASLSVVGKDITYDIKRLDETGSCFDVFGRSGAYEDCLTRMPGDFQPLNCAVAVGLCEELLQGASLDARKIKKGIEKAFLPGRLEIIGREPLIVIDGAQNGESARRLRSSVERIFDHGRLILLLGMSKDKDIKSVCEELAPLADSVVLTRASIERAADPLLIRGYIKGKKVTVTGDTREALGAALSRAGKNDTILATGSFFVIGEIRRMILGDGKGRC